MKRLLLILAIAAAAVPVALSTTGRAAADAPAAAALSTPAHPVIDVDFLYRELYNSSTDYIFRVAGADGPPSDPSNVNNLPRNANGANEFYAWWKREMTSTANDHMGPMGRFVTANDHFEPCCSGAGNQTFPFQLDDATVTVPGQSCPGQAVLISGHNDSTPTSTAVATPASTGSAVPMSNMRSGNWGNGSPYDADSGIAMGMAELQGLLRWYQANGTYPKRTIKVGLFDAEETGLVGSGLYSQTDTPTTLAAAAAAGATNIKVASVNGIAAGSTIVIDQAGVHESHVVSTVGTSGANGSGLTLASPLGAAFTTGTTVTRTALGLIPDGPQGQYVMVANMDQNGLEYPAYHWGTQHYLNDITGGTVGPWYTNINAVPLTPNGQYPATSAAWARIQANMTAVQAFRNATSDAVSQAFQVLGQKYDFSLPLENPLRLDQVGSTPLDPTPHSIPAYTPEDMAKYSPVVDDALGRTDQQSFINRGIPGYGIVGAYDSSTVQTIGGNENPYPASYTSKPTLGQYAGYDTNDDTIQHLNYWASGVTHGPGGVDQPSEALKRALELPATWTDYLIQKDDYAGAEPKGANPITYFETSPAKPTTTNTVTFDASFSRNAGGQANGLRYYWDFGDGATTATSGTKVTHTYASTAPHWYDVKLVVSDGAGHWGYYRQALAVEFQPTLFPATPPASEPAPPSTPACGTLTAAEQAEITPRAQQAFRTIQLGDVSGTVPATLSLSLGGPAGFGAFTPGVADDYDATMNANVVSTAGSAALTVGDASSSSTGHLVNGAFSLASPLQAKASSPLGTGSALAPVGGGPTPLLSYANPASNDPVELTFRQHIGATDSLRTGTYSKTLTFTLSTTDP
jgi:PKD domain/Peptidase family M28